MAFQLPKLPYDYDSLEPYIDEKTVKIHHDLHHGGYVNNLNKALEGKDNLYGKSIEELLLNINTVDKDIRQSVINNAGGHINHTLYWEIMSPKKSHADSPLLEAIMTKFGNMETFQAKFSEKALSLFGSGWVFLTVDKDDNLAIKRHSFQNSPLMFGKTPILGLDVWEHAYYLKYQNKRADYIKAWWNVVNWEKVSRNFNEAIK